MLFHRKNNQETKMSYIQTITVNEGNIISNELPELRNDMKIESQTEAITDVVAAPLPEHLYVIMYLTIIVLTLLLGVNVALFWWRLKRNKECDICDSPQETSEDSKEINEDETTEESSPDEDTQDASETTSGKECDTLSQDETTEEESSDQDTEATSEDSSSEKECDSVSQDSVEITLEIENFNARNTVAEGLNESKSENCDECEKVFDTKNSLMSHIVEEHTNTSNKQSEEVETSVEIHNVNNITSASTVRNPPENVNISISDLLLESSSSGSKDVSIDMGEFISTESKLPTNITSASTVIVPTPNTSNVSNNVSIPDSVLLESETSKYVSIDMGEFISTDSKLPTNITSASTVIVPTPNMSTISNNVDVEAQPDRSKEDMFESTTSFVVQNEAAKVNSSENTSAESLPPRTDLKRKSRRRRSGKNNRKNLLLTIPCRHCDLSFASENSLGQHLVMKHN